MDLFIERGGLRHELIDIGLQKVVLLRVEILEEHLGPLYGRFIVDGWLGHVLALKRGNHELRRSFVDWTCRNVGRLGPHHERNQAYETERRQGTQHGSSHQCKIP